MTKEYTALGLMSGTSGDGVDATIIKSDGKSKYNVIIDKYFNYDDNIYNEIHRIKEKINNKSDLTTYLEELKSLEKKITLFHAKVIKNITGSMSLDIIGFHGQTIYHNPSEKISKQLGDANLLFSLFNKNIVFNFRENDLKNGGVGAPLTPIFHQLALKQKKIQLPACILNIGGISNITKVSNFKPLKFMSRDIGPGNCLIDVWTRKNSKQKFDRDGILSKTGRINEIILEQAYELYTNTINGNNISLDVNDFDVSFARGLSLEDGLATLTEFTAKIIASELFKIIPKETDEICKIFFSGGGRNNGFLLERIKKHSPVNLIFKNIDVLGINGDFVESQAFAYLAIRSYIGEPISFPETTGCSKPCIGGDIIKIT